MRAVYTFFRASATAFCFLYFSRALCYTGAMRWRRRFRKLQRKRIAKRRRIRFWTCAALLCVLTAAAFFLHRFPGLFTKEPEPGQFEGPYAVVHVTDGDTLILSIEGTETAVRLIGIDAPESVHRDTEKNTPEGAEASHRLKELAAGKTVFLEYDERRYDQYGRTLAYVRLEDGSLLQDVLLKEGLAVTSPLEPNERYTEHFAQLEKQAKEEKTGFWGTGFFS